MAVNELRNVTNMTDETGLTEHSELQKSLETALWQPDRKLSWSNRQCAARAAQLRLPPQVQQRTKVSVMTLPHIVVSAALLLLGAQPSHHHFPHLGRICAGPASELGFTTEALMDGEIHGNLTLDRIVMGFPGALVQHEAPTVVLLEPRTPNLELTGQLLSSDLPGFWIPVRYGSLTVEVRVPISAEMAEPVENVVLLMDNRPLDPTRYSDSREFRQMLDGGFLAISYRYNLPCPPPGQHILQARYKVNGLWSRLSSPLHFDVRLPDPPQIIGVSDSTGNPLPIGSSQMISITGPSLKLQLAQVNHNASLVAYLNGKPIMLSKPEASCCRTVPLEGHITPGVHRLTVRTVHADDGCSITSEPSNEVVFHYYDEDVYLLKPGTHCNNRCYPFVHPPACVVPAAAPTPSSSDSRTQPLPPPQNSLKSPTPLTPSAMKHVPQFPRAHFAIEPSAFHMPASEELNGTIEPWMSFVALQQGGYIEAARQMLESTKEFRDSAATAAGAATTAATEASEHARLAAVAAAKAKQQQEQATKSRDAARSRATEAVRAREEAIAARTVADLALGQARIRAKEIEQHVTNGNGAAAEAARVHLEAAHAAAGAAANEALKQRDLAAQRARSAAAHLAEVSALVRQESGLAREARRPTETFGMIGKLLEHAAAMARRAVDSGDELWDDMLAANRWAEKMEELADREEAKADAWIRTAEAEMRINRAAAITGPPSPFYFAAPAHFPIRGFGSRGEVIERPGAVIYEDMVFSFDRHGNYHLRFSILIPELPTTLHLQLQLQPHPAGPWHTITLPPQQFRPDDSSDSRPQPKLIRDYVVEGRSEILHRCYGEMGQDATIRRTGSARFGYGFDAMRQATAY
jgi:hypothetical protein